MKKSTNYCSRDVPYPESAIALVLDQHIEDAGNVLVPYAEVFSDSKKISTRLSDYQKELLPLSITISDTAILLPLTISRYFPLKPEYWDEPTSEFDLVSRIPLFNRMLGNTQFYELLVTPGREKNRWYFKSALPIRIGTPDRAIDEFMKRSDWYVDPTAKTCAIYTVGMPWMFNFKTGERHAITKSPSSLPEDVN